MRIMIDTNIIISAILFPNSSPSRFIEEVTSEHSIVLCSHIIDELHRVFNKKFKDKLLYLEKFLSKFSFELVYTPQDIEVDKYPNIRDVADLPILVSAIIEDVDVIVTGDKDFFDVEIEKPEIITVKEYFERYN
ncbi:MAG TPA: putative toxin-antitoxin system toxin component, PIN family [Clostridia bacterium]|jgi:putative PIN family toxin of toxin-antitoxin system|nr:putative toxin-antitoxin system toxin component, PIN family [Clostridia bacterium]